jgi:hypothetical protein
MARFMACGLLLAALTAAAGCRGSSAQATGKVTLNGQPVPDAEVVFRTDARPDAAVFGKSGADGSYYLNYPTPDALPAGKYKVTVTRYSLKNGKPLPPGEEGEALRADEEKVLRHDYVFDKEVVAGQNRIDLELKEARKQ